ncbi:MAG: CBS domain-containing protein [Nitrospirae bacterium CG08_land_8_20_14_0_20_52_24]|nr:MAG: CBS domain-containing protein [Nitrospirae bacterium CG08_land_8_20_14_0_20_52_24]PIW86047.1 MAG: CBS domain-containing protein [Nitrospirae bacterium CG_4_8_14_3_um_filter_50_41]
MPNNKAVKDLMIDVFDYPHIPYWFTIRQAIGVIRKSMIEAEKCFNPLAILVFDEKYNLMGTLSLKDILRGLEPTFLSASTKAQGYAESEETLAIVWDSLFAEGSKTLAEKPVSDIMVPIRGYVGPEDPVTKAAYLMIHQDSMLLPVIENKKIVGIIRIKEVFEEIAGVD